MSVHACVHVCVYVGEQVFESIYVHALYIIAPLFMSYTSPWLMFFVENTTMNKVYLILSYLILIK